MRRLPQIFMVALILLVCLIAVADDREMADLFHNAGVKALESGDKEKAAGQFQKALKRYPTHPDAVVQLGIIFTSQVDISGLTKLYGEWLKAFKGLAQPSRKQIEVSVKLKSRLTDLYELEKINKKYSKKFAALGRSLKRKDKDAALKAYANAMEIDPGNSSAARDYKKLAGAEFDSSDKSKGPVGKKDFKLGKLVVSEDYSTPSNHWYQRDNFCWYKNGKYFVQSEPGFTYSSRYEEKFRPSDFYMEVELRLLEKQTEGAAGGFLFCHNSDGSCYFYMITFEGKFGAWVNSRTTGKKDFTGKEVGPPQKLTCSATSKHIKKGKSKNLLAVAKVGTKMFCYVNKKKILSFEDAAVSSGCVGFMVNPGSKYEYDNFKLYEVAPLDSGKDGK